MTIKKLKEWLERYPEGLKVIREEVVYPLYPTPDKIRVEFSGWKVRIPQDLCELLEEAIRRGEEHRILNIILNYKEVKQ